MAENAVSSVTTFGTDLAALACLDQPPLTTPNATETTDAKQPPMVTDNEPKSEVAGNLIEIRVNDIAQLFHTLDPFPFGRKTSPMRPRITL